MATLYFRVASDYEEVIRLREEIEKLEKTLQTMDVSKNKSATKEIEKQLSEATSKMQELVSKASQAGIEVDNKFSFIGKSYQTLSQTIVETEERITLSMQKISDSASKILDIQESLGVVQKTATITQTVTSAPSSVAQSSNIDTSQTTAIQAQVKAYEELESEINAVLGTRSANIKRLIDEQNAIRLLNVEIKQINKYTAENGELSKAQQTRLIQLNDSLLTHKTALAEVQQILRNQGKLDNATVTSMDELAQSLARMRITYRALSDEEKASPFGKNLQASIDVADTKIKSLDATMGNYQRNVGNYKEAWNGLGNSIQQVARELPSMAYGPQTFFAAISNNVPILADELKRANVEYKALTASGQAATPVWKQVLGSIFNWQTALVAGVTILTLYGKELIDFVSKMFEAKSAISLTSDEIQAMHKNFSDAAAKDIANLDVLFSKLRNAKKGTDEYNQAKASIISQYGQYLQGLNAEISSLQNQELAYKALTRAIYDRAKAQAIETANTGYASDRLKKQGDAYLRKSKKRLRRNMGKNKVIVYSQHCKDN